MNIFVGNLSKEVTDLDLQETFEKFGKIKSVKVIVDIFTQQSKGFGFVEMYNDKEAAVAIEKLNVTELKGKMIQVNKARPPRKGKGRRF
ncbi:MAG: RNA-binding protein [Ignavibacteria bacterium]|jgi:RNA recognition motif-containing protein